ncbi:MAG TPA: RDD family protein [Solirubrobacterales bacterium]|nr:RDD family protein [Solirubrobacterales bacterium]
MNDGPDPQASPQAEGPSGRPLPLSVRLLGAGVRGARTVGKATGVEQAVQSAAEEAMVAAVESEAVERALVRVLQGPLVEETVHSALQSEAVKRALIEALDSEMIDEVWRRLLASDEAQRLVERIAEAPELRAAISAQSVGFIEDVGHTIGDATRRLDGVIERIARRVVFRRRRTEPTERAGALTRGLAFGLDLLIVNLTFSGLAAVLALIGSFFSGTGNGLSGFALALGSAAWVALGSLYLVTFWSLAGQTPGMRFFGIRLGVESRGLPPRRSLKRLFGLFLAAIPFGLGFLGVLFDERRRGWQDRLAGVDVLYESREPTVAPWSILDVPEPLAVAGGPETTKAPGSRGLRPQQVSGSPLGG